MNKIEIIKEFERVIPLIKDEHKKRLVVTTFERVPKMEDGSCYLLAAYHSLRLFINLNIKG